MKIELQDTFVLKLNHQVAYIARDKPQAARKFKNDVLQLIRGLAKHPYKYRKSIYFDQESLRDMSFKGYTIVYNVDKAKNVITVFGFIRHEEKL